MFFFNVLLLLLFWKYFSIFFFLDNITVRDIIIQSNLVFGIRALALRQSDGRRANALMKGYCSKRQLLKSLLWPIYIINSVHNTKLPCYTIPPMHYHSFFRNLPSLFIKIHTLIQFIKLNIVKKSLIPTYFFVLKMKISERLRWSWKHKYIWHVQDPSNPLSQSSKFSFIWFSVYEY